MHISRAKQSVEVCKIISNIALYPEKLLIESTRSLDYEFLKKGSEKADGINDVEEFGITEVSKKLSLALKLKLWWDKLEN